MHDGTHGDELSDRIETLVFLAQLADEWKLLVDQLFAEMAQIEMDNSAIWTRDGSSLLEFLYERL